MNPIDIPQFNNLKKFATFLMYGPLQELKRRQPNNAFLDYCETVVVNGYPTESFFRDHLLAKLYTVDMRRHYVDIICEIIGDTQTALDFTNKLTARYICHDCHYSREQPCTTWSLLFAETDMWNGPNDLENILNSFWGRPTTNKCPTCSAPLTICWMNLEMAKYVVIDFSRGGSRKVIPPLSLRSHSLFAYGIGNRISVQIDGDENTYGEYEDGVVREASKSATKSELSSENLNLLIYKKL